MLPKIEPVGGDMIAAVLMLLVLAGAATVAGVRVIPTDAVVVGGAYAILVAGFEGFRRFVKWRCSEDAKVAVPVEMEEARRYGREQHVDAQRLLNKLNKSNSALLALLDYRYTVEDDGTVREKRTDGT